MRRSDYEVFDIRLGDFAFSLNMEESKLEELRIDEGSSTVIPRGLLNMHKDFLELLCDRLPISDQLRFGRVCRTCRSLVYERPDPKAYETPWLIGLGEDSTFCGKSIHKQMTCYHVQPESFQHPKPYIIGSFKGWLFLQYGEKNFIQLVNFASDIHLDLPPLSTMKTYIDLNKFAVAFAVSFCRFMRPIMIAIVTRYGELAFCKIGGSAWLPIVTGEQYVSVAFYNMKLYAMRKNYDKVDIFEIDHDLKIFLVGGIEIDDALKLFPLAVPGSSRFINSPSRGNRQFLAYLVVESQGNNLFLVMHHRKEVKVEFLTVEFEVYKVCGDRLMKVDTLGDQIVLLNGSCSEMIDAKDCSPSLYFHGNQICFKNSKNVGIYSFKDGIVNWLPRFRGFQSVHWMFPRLAGKCHCESHTMHCPKLSEPSSS